MLISVRILLKLYEAIVNSAFSLINYHLIEIDLIVNFNPVIDYYNPVIDYYNPLP